MSTINQRNPKATLLIVDSAPQSRQVLEVSLRRAGFLVVAFGDGAEALEKIEVVQPDVVVVDTGLTGGDGFEFFEQVGKDPRWTHVPFVLLTAQGEIEKRLRGIELGAGACLEKPFLVKEIIGQIEFLLEKVRRKKLIELGNSSAFDADFEELGLVDLVHVLENGGSSGVVNFRNEEGKRGTIWFKDGQMVSAELGKLKGSDAVCKLLLWNEGAFSVELGPIEIERNIEGSNEQVLAEGLRRVDQWGWILEQLPPLDTVFEVDFKVLAERIGEIPDEVNALLRLFDGRRSVLNVLDKGAFEDLEALGIIAKLYFEGLIVEFGQRVRGMDNSSESQNTHDAVECSLKENEYETEKFVEGLTSQSLTKDLWSAKDVQTEVGADSFPVGNPETVGIDVDAEEEKISTAKEIEANSEVEQDAKKVGDDSAAERIEQAVVVGEEIPKTGETLLSENIDMIEEVAGTAEEADLAEWAKDEESATEPEESMEVSEEKGNEVEEYAASVVYKEEEEELDRWLSTDDETGHGIQNAAEVSAALAGVSDRNEASIDVKDETFFASEYGEPKFGDEYLVQEQRSKVGRWTSVVLSLVIAAAIGTAGYTYYSSPYVGEGLEELDVAAYQAGRKKKTVADIPRIGVGKKLGKAVQTSSPPSQLSRKPEKAISQKGAGTTKGSIYGKGQVTAAIVQAKKFLQKGEKNNAYKLFSQALKLDPDCWEALEQLAVRSMTAGQMKQALVFAERAKKINTNAPYAYLVIGSVMAEDPRKKKVAKETLMKFLELCPRCDFVRDIRLYVKQL
ncbi:MAG: DUF4388 domain-containing protein [Pseudomonadota bacterium]